MLKPYIFDFLMEPPVDSQVLLVNYTKYKEYRKWQTLSLHFLQDINFSWDHFHKQAVFKAYDILISSIYHILTLTTHSSDLLLRRSYKWGFRWTYKRKYVILWKTSTSILLQGSLATALPQSTPVWLLYIYPKCFANHGDLQLSNSKLDLWMKMVPRKIYVL